MSLLKKTGLPEESELVLCTVTSVQSHSVFVNLEEYKTGGMIHISEVSPGRIRNMRDFVREGKVVVCKVLRVSRERGQVDLSLRRVTDAQRRGKINDIKQHQKAEKIIETAAAKLKTEPKTLFDEVYPKVTDKYQSLYAGFSEVAEDRASLTKLGVSKKSADELTASIKQRIKPVEVSIQGDLKLISFAPDGVEHVKDSLKKVIDSGAEVLYVRAGKYHIAVKAANYKAAEQIIQKSTAEAINHISTKEGEGEFTRQ
ncbi:S1 RNA-binding domain-containing protein [Candidatus Woesearchaeota archaeon]|nr:S1 RNA-binding domain-containing protein [Candidatus Woesearchaeota archaeon]